jgi:hypothetical protein
MELVDPSRWLRQARLDFRAAQVAHDGILDCHRRYWFQQSYEKAIKAFAIAAISDADDQFLQVFQDYFLRHHSPVFFFGLKSQAWDDVELELRKRFPNSWESVLRQLRLLRRSLEQFEKTLKNWSTLQRIDATMPSLSPNVVSYRYPFFERANRPETAIAPADFKGWAVYQGDESTVNQAIQELFDRVGERVQLSKLGRAKRKR